MKSLQTSIKEGVRVVVLALLLSVGVTYVFANWEAPKNTPPTCVTDPDLANYQDGCLPPIHVGIKAQEKEGALTVGAFESKLLAIFDTQVRIKGTAPSAGKVLTSVNNIGDAVWAPWERTTAQLACEDLGGIWNTATTPDQCDFPQGGSGVTLQQICTGLGGTYVASPVEKCTVGTTTGGPGGDGITSLTGGTGITLNPTTIVDTGIVSIDPNGVCVALGGTFSGGKCNGLGGGITRTYDSGWFAVTAAAGAIPATYVKTLGFIPDEFDVFFSKANDGSKPIYPVKTDNYNGNPGGIYAIFSTKNFGTPTQINQIVIKIANVYPWVLWDQNDVANDIPVLPAAGAGTSGFLRIVAHKVQNF